jgi:hypothetical protein
MERFARRRKQQMSRLKTEAAAQVRIVASGEEIKML